MQFDLGKIKLNWRGQFDSDLIYEPDDLVYHDGSSYIAIAKTQVGSLLSDKEYWDDFAQGLSDEERAQATNEAVNASLAAVAKQTIQNDVTGAYYYSSTSAKEITPLNTSITPSSKDRRVLVMVSLFYEAHHDSVFKLTRNGTQLSIPSSPGSRRAGIMSSAYDQNQSSTPAFQTLIYLDSPNSTDLLTYRLLHEGQALALNRTISNTNSAAYERGTSRMILMEI